MADQQDLASATVMDLGLAVHLGDERTGRVEGEEPAALRLLGHRLRHPMRREHDGRARIGNLGQVLDEDGALGAQAVHHVPVMHDLVAHIDRGAVERERPFDRLDGAHHAGTEAARRAQHDVEDRLPGRRSGGICFSSVHCYPSVPSGHWVGHGPGTLPCQGDTPATGIAQTGPCCLYNYRIPVIPDDNCVVPQGRAKSQG